MIVESVKTKNNLELEVFNLASYQKDKEFSNKNRLHKFFAGALLLFLLSTNVILFSFLMSKTTTIFCLQNQVGVLQKDVDMLKFRLLQELSQFKLKSYADDNKKQLDYNNYVDDLKEYEENKDKRSKREILSATLDGVPIIAESYAQERKHNTNYSTSSSEGLRLYESLGKNILPATKDHTSGWTPRTYMNHRRVSSSHNARPTAVLSRSSRVMHTEDKSKLHRKLVKKSLTKSSNLQEHVESIHVTVTPPTPRRTHRHGGGRGGNKRNGNLETADVVAAHFYGNTSHLVANQHHGYRGNGHLAHPQGLYVDWQTSSWVSSLGTERTLQLNQGEVLVLESGLYLIYAQIYYVDEHDVNGFHIMKNGAELAQCTTMTHTERKLDKRNSCWTGTLAALADGDRVSIRDIETHRYAYMAHGKSFFGLIKLADLNSGRHQHHSPYH